MTKYVSTLVVLALVVVTSVSCGSGSEFGKGLGNLGGLIPTGPSPSVGPSPFPPVVEPTPVPTPVPVPDPAPTPDPIPVPEPPAPVPPPILPSTAFDGSWIGTGSGIASDSTPVTVSVELEIANGGITKSRIDYNFPGVVGPPLLPSCRFHHTVNYGSTWALPIVENSFLQALAENKSYIYTQTLFKGRFTSAVEVVGTVTLVNTGPFKDACPANATLEWRATKR